MPEIGIYGLGLLGQSLAFTFANNKIQCSVSNTTAGLVRQVVERADEVKVQDFIKGFEQIEEFINSLESPRKIILAFKSDGLVNKAISKFKKLLEPEDILIDIGIDNYEKYIERERIAMDYNINYVSVGIGGGELVYRDQACYMVSGKKEIFEKIEKYINAISIKNQNKPCVVLSDGSGSGPFLRMIYSGLEYGEMQLLCEVYDMMKCYGLEDKEISRIFIKWNDSEFNSELLRVTCLILNKQDCDIDGIEPSESNLLDKILDCAFNKGSGKECQRVGLRNKSPLTLLNESLSMRFMSELSETRKEASNVLNIPSFSYSTLDKDVFLTNLKDSYICSRIILYDQSLNFVKTFFREKEWSVDITQLLFSWTNGCNISSNLLNTLILVYEQEKDTHSILVSPDISKILNELGLNWRKIVSVAVATGHTLPCMTSALSYYDNYRRGKVSYDLLMNLLESSEK